MSARSFWITPEGRLRAPVRIAAFLVFAMAVYFVVGILGDWIFNMASVGAARVILYPYLLVGAIVIAHLFALRVLEGGASWSSIGLGAAQASPGVLSSGLLVGALAIGVPSLLLLLTHALTVSHAPAGSWWHATLRLTVFLLPAALLEELFLRGYIFAVLREAVGWQWTLIGTSITFGLMHMYNPGANPGSTLLVIIAGFFLGMIVLVTRSVYASWMAHFAWNWTMAAVMHTAVSGLGLATPNYQVTDNGPDWLTGGAWGPEGGLAAGASMIVITLFYYGRYMQKMGRPRHRTHTLNAQT